MSFNPTGASIATSSDVALSSVQDAQVLTYETATAKWRNKPAPTVADATTTTKGQIQLAGDLSGTAAAPTVPGLANKADGGANSDITSITGLTTPLALGQGGTGSATKNFTDLTTAQTVAGIKTFSSSPIVPTPSTGTQAANKTYVDSVAPVDATTIAKGIVQLAGDLAGTAASPSVAKVKGITISATAPTSGQVLTASSTTAAAWAAPATTGVFTPVAKTANYTAANFDFVVCNATTAGFTVTLPTAVAGGVVRVLKTDASGNAVVVAGNGNATLAGNVSYSVNVRWMSQDFASDGTNWYCV